MRELRCRGLSNKSWKDKDRKGKHGIHSFPKNFGCFWEFSDNVFVMKRLPFYSDNDKTFIMPWSLGLERVLNLQIWIFDKKTFHCWCWVFLILMSWRCFSLLSNLWQWKTSPIHWDKTKLYSQMMNDFSSSSSQD